MVYFICGDERYLINRKEKDLIKSAGIDNIIRYDMEESAFLDVLNEVNYIDLFNERKLVIVSNFSLKKLSSSEEEGLINFIESNSENAIIIKCFEKCDERKKIVKLLREKDMFFEFKKLMYGYLENYVYELFKEKGYKVDKGTSIKLCKKLEYNSDLVFSEVDKLMMYRYEEKSIISSDIDDVIEKNYEKEMFNFSDAVMSRDLGKMFTSYKTLVNMKTEVTVLIDYLSKQFRILYQIKNMNSFNFSELSRRLNVNEYVIKKLYNNINNFKNDEIIKYIESLYEADEQIKIYGYDKYKVFENFMINV